jgi:AAA ATPase domain
MRTASSGLIGRDGPLAALDAALTGAGSGRPSAVLVGGEAGVGKSRLVSAFAERSSTAGARVLTGECLELGAGGLPFAPFTAVLRDLVRDLGADGVTGLLPAGAAREFARLLPEFGEPAGAGDAGEARARLFEQMLILLEQLAERDRVVLVIEDAHWADQSTRDLLLFLIRNQRALEGLLIVVTYRSDELHRTHALRPLLAELERISWVTKLELGKLTRPETAALAARIAGHEPDQAVLEAVWRRAEGNPLFVEALMADGELSAGLPDSLRDLLGASVRHAARAQASQPPRRAAIIETDMLEGMGQHELAVTVAREGIAAAREHGLARTQGVILAINLAEPLVSLGRWDEAAEVIDRAPQLFPPPPSRSVLWRLSGDIALARGDLAAAAGSAASIKAAAGRGRAEQSRHRRRAVHLREDRERARVQHSRQAGRVGPGRGRRPGTPAPPVRVTPEGLWPRRPGLRYVVLFLMRLRCGAAAASGGPARDAA